MKNIPVFTSSYGIATLILREIPWNRTAYVLIRSVWNDQKAALLEDCKGFCRAVGAEQIYASWELEMLPAEPVWDMQIMTRPKAGLPKSEKPVEPEPLTKENSTEYLRIYNECFRSVPCAASYDERSLEPLYGEDLAWLAKVDGVYVGVAEISKTGLEGIAVLPEYKGLGYELALAVLPMVPAAELRLKVASTNRRAVSLYERLGFVYSGTEKRWWRL